MSPWFADLEGQLAAILRKAMLPTSQWRVRSNDVLQPAIHTSQASPGDPDAGATDVTLPPAKLKSSVARAWANPLGISIAQSASRS